MVLGRRHAVYALAVAGLLFVSGAESQPAPERHVEGQVLTSERDPAVRIELPQGLNYIGADRFRLFDNADCEFHVFADSDASGQVRRVLWVQFEG
jgi:hypothetical protein